MRVLTALLLVGAFALAAASVAQAARIMIHCKNTTVEWTPQVGQYVQFNNAPTSEEGETCFGNTVDQLYDGCGVPSACSAGSLVSVDVLTDNASLNGKRVKITQVDGGDANCFKICDVCP